MMKKIFYVADFFANGKYSFGESTYVELENAIKGYEGYKREWGGLINSESILSLIKVSDTFSYKFSIKKFLNNILEYLNEKHKMEMVFKETNRLFDETEYRKFGNLHYDNVIKLIQRSVELGKTIYNIRLFHVLYNHKLGLKQRIEYLEEKGYVILGKMDGINQIVKEALIIRNIIIKKSIQKSTDGLLVLISRLKQMKEKEYRLLMQVIEYFMERDIEYL